MSLPFPTYRLDAETAYDRGLQYGRAAKEQIAVSIETYQRLFRDFVGIDWPEARRLGEVYAEPINRFDPDLLQEIYGVAEGSGYGADEILALNARSEIALNSRTVRPEVVDGCTSFAAFGHAARDGGTILAQNWDWRAAQRDAFVIVLVERPGKPSITMLTEGGIIGKMGYNSAGVGVSLNAILTAEVALDKAPLHIVLRGILEARNIGEAIEAVGRCGVGSAANFLVAQHGNGAIDIEAVPSNFDMLLPERDMLVHTNHLQSLRLAVLGVRDLSMYLAPDSWPRLARAQRLMDDRYGRIDVDAAQEVLRDHANEPDSICRHEDEVGDPEGKRMQSVFFLVMDLKDRELYITDGPPCCSEFVPFREPVEAVLA